MSVCDYFLCLCAWYVCIKQSECLVIIAVYIGLCEYVFRRVSFRCVCACVCACVCVRARVCVLLSFVYCGSDVLGC